MTARLEFALDAVYRAGRMTLGHFQAGRAVEFKADSSPVTAADREAEQAIRRAIAEAYPGEAILGEEEGQTGSGEDRWVLDPIDGTKSFVCGVPLFASLLSYERAGAAELGVCYFPALELMLYAERGQGAFANGRRARVSDKKSCQGAVLCCGGHSSMAQHGRMDRFLRLAEGALATRTWCDAYGHAMVAMGTADAMVDPVVKRWDISAMSVIVEEAGGKFTDFEGRAGLWPEALSSNGAIHRELVGAFRA